VVIETTGLADPAPILHAVLYHPYLSMRYALEGVVTVVDAVNAEDTLRTHREAVRQVAVAERVVIAKADLVDAGRLARLTSRILDLNPGAVILPGDAPVVDVLSGGLFGLDGKIASVGDWLRTEAVEAAEHASHAHRHGPSAHAHGSHAHAGHHAHDVNRHDASIRAFCLTSDAPVRQAALDIFLDLLRSAQGAKLLRVKGLVGLAEDPEHPVVIHGVQHVIHVPATLPRWPDADRRTRIVFIVDGIGREAVERLWNAVLGKPSIDEPDAAALTDNPLSLRR
ncbi:MAG: GTP-binding protein, partial [Microvirga sp.]